MIGVKMGPKAQALTTWKRLTVVCEIKYNQRGDEKSIMQIIPVAATFGDKGLNAKTSLLPSAEATEVEGVKVELHGPTYKETEQMAIIELTCDRSVEVSSSPLSTRLPIRGVLLLLRYAMFGATDYEELHYRSFNEGILRLDWRTKYACPTTVDKPSNDKDKEKEPDNTKPTTKHWGFLTWLIIMYLPLSLLLFKPLHFPPFSLPIPLSPPVLSSGLKLTLVSSWSSQHT